MIEYLNLGNSKQKTKMFLIHPITSTIVGLFITLNLVYQFLLLYTSPDTFLTAPDRSGEKLRPKLYLRPDGTFRIAIFSDLHLGEQESNGVGARNDELTRGVMEGLLEVEKPDFVVLNGDLISGERTYLENSTKYVDNLVAPLVEKNYKWASTYGNHDTQYNLSREALFREETKYEQSYTRHSPPGVGGVTNYWIPIYHQRSSRTPSFSVGGDSNSDSDAEIALTDDDNLEQENDKPAAILYFFDSLGGENYQRSRIFRFMPNWVVSSAVSYFTTQSSLIAARWGPDIPSFAFVHIPTSAFKSFAADKLPKKGDRDARFPGLNGDVPVDEQGQGRWWHRDRGFVDALAQVGVLGVFSGHDHGDSWCGVSGDEDGERKGNAKGPFLCFCKRTGYGGYGDWNRGGRVLGLKFNGEGKEGVEVETWVRMESGSVVQKVSLNETYGTDVYPADDLGEDPAR